MKLWSYFVREPLAVKCQINTFVLKSTSGNSGNYMNTGFPWKNLNSTARTWTQDICGSTVDHTVERILLTLKHCGGGSFKSRSTAVGGGGNTPPGTG